MGIDHRIFLGIIETSEIRMHLNKSKIWEEKRLLETSELKEIEREGKIYIGFLIPPALSYDQLKLKEEKIKKLLQVYCPKLNLYTHQCYIFLQVFVL